MAQQQQQLIPPPPSYYRLFTDDGARPVGPPPIPSSDALFTVFGEGQSRTPTLPSVGTKLYKSRADGSLDIKGELAILHSELVAAFLQLLDVLIENPTMYGRAVQKVSTVLTNMQQLVNALRPIQARVTLTARLKQQTIEKRKTIEELKKVERSSIEQLEEVIQKLQSGYAP